MRILVTGGNGQLGQCLKDLVLQEATDGCEFVFKSSTDLDISDLAAVMEDFRNGEYTYCINCAAYTQVDKAEFDIETAIKSNVIGPRNLAMACNRNRTTLIHISTDFVFDGKKKTPYTEDVESHPVNVYGSTKLDGELTIGNNLNRYFILRTSWLFSEHGNNFMKTMLRLGQQQKELSVVSDQLGSPTYAKDLAQFILDLMASESEAYGIYHFSNQGTTSWHGFAKAIFHESKMPIKLYPISTEEYPTAAERPKYSVLDVSKLKRTFDVEISNWEESLQRALKACS